MAKDLGASFAVSPDLTPELLSAAQKIKFPFLPGVATSSDIMLGLNHGFDTFKLFPAAVLGGVPYLKALSGPFPSVKFCPTGGIKSDNFLSYLKMANVSSIGGSWLSPSKSTVEGDWEGITHLTKDAVANLKPLRSFRVANKKDLPRGKS